MKTAVLIGGIGMVVSLWLTAQTPSPGKPAHTRDVIQEAQTPETPAKTRVEQKKTSHDADDRFSAAKAPPVAAPIADQPDQGQLAGFDFYRDPLNARKPMQTFGETMQADKAARAAIMDAQHKLLAQRYNLEPKFDPEVKMSRGKPIRTVSGEHDNLRAFRPMSPVVTDPMHW